MPILKMMFLFKRSDMLVFRRVIPTTLHPSWLAVFYHQFEKSAGQIGDDCPQIFGVKIQKNGENTTPPTVDGWNPKQPLGMYI